MEYKRVLPVNSLILKYASLHSSQRAGTEVVSASTQYNFFPDSKVGYLSMLFFCDQDSIPPQVKPF